MSTVQNERRTTRNAKVVVLVLFALGALLLGAVVAVGCYGLLLHVGLGVWWPSNMAPDRTIAVVGENSPYMYYQLDDGQIARCTGSNSQCETVDRVPALVSSAVPCGPEDLDWKPKPPPAAISVVVQRYCGGVDVFLEDRFVLMPGGEVLHWGFWAGNGLWIRSDVDGAASLGAIIGLFGGLIGYAFAFPDRPATATVSVGAVKVNRERS